MALQIRKAKKEKLGVKVLCSGSSGSGKTYTALRLATGIVNRAGGRIVMINTEGNRGDLYSKDFDYDVIDLDEPRSPERYIEAISLAIANGATVVIIDSLSHEWNYLNEGVNNMPGNSFNNWGRQKPRHRKLSDFIAETSAHIIATGRGKDEYIMELNEKGKQTPKKVGVGVQQEKDTEYEYMVTFNIAQDTHVATVMKDNTHLFEGRYDVLTEKDGEKLYDWANDGEASSKVSQADLMVVRNDIINLARELGGSKNKTVCDLCMENIGTLNPNASDDIKGLKALHEALLKEKQGGK